ncbi:hypothetical protein CSKR_111310 [Clonorchis sinensis]|uniref:Uncharacterized protein n=1 Tax=Clonorchis sinensis TaxID=79923 RepID=A0A3R7CQK0_CLOSI|nr:hypothetical protein CSKR_111310 [Clonorchis sinensis]
MPIRHASRRKYKGRDIAMLPKPRQRKSRRRGRIRTTDLLVTSQPSQPMDGDHFIYCRRVTSSEIHSMCFAITDPLFPPHSGNVPKTSMWLKRELTVRKVLGTNPTLHLNFSCLGLGNLAVFRSSCFLRETWQLGTERVLQLNDHTCRV